MKVLEFVVIAGELLRFICGMVGLFVWAAWQDASSWVLRRFGFIRLANEREALADRTFKDLFGYDVYD